MTDPLDESWVGYLVPTLVGLLFLAVLVPSCTDEDDEEGKVVICMREVNNAI